MNPMSKLVSGLGVTRAPTASIRPSYVAGLNRMVPLLAIPRRSIRIGPAWHLAADTTIRVSLFAAIAIVLSSILFPTASVASEECINIFYDRSKESDYQYGRTTAIFLENLLGHFPEFRPAVAPIETYEKGQIERCRASFYIGSYYDNGIPKAFLRDFVSTRKRVAWIGYSLWQLKPEQLEKALGVKYLRLTKLDISKRDARDRPTFYKTILYKGESFAKYGEFKPRSKDEFQAPYEMTALEIVSPQTETLAVAVHNGDGSRLPYAIRRGNRFYVADLPFAYIHEADRYLVFADLLFDILDAPPRHKKRLAVFRVEDVSARTDPEGVLTIAKIARSLNIRTHIALIPIFADPFGVLGSKVARGISIKADPKFAETLKQLSPLGVTFIWHGVTHQFNDLRNPKGVSGYDFEFWDINANAPVPGDSAQFVLDRLNEGWTSMSAVNVKPRIWEVPHYACSVTDYLVFARVFSWNIGRMRYQPFVAHNLPAAASDSLWYENTGVAGHEERSKFFERLSVSTLGEVEGQFFPYEIHRDIYGQRVLPENLGYVDYMGSAAGVDPVNVILANAKRNLVLRDAWASFYFHPFFIKRPGAEGDLERLLKSIQELGYEFVDLEEFIRLPK